MATEESNNKQKYAGLIVLGLVIIGSILFFVWGAFLNRGSIILSGETPFAVEVFDEVQAVCVESPCTLEVKAGDKNIIVRKDGYQEQLVTGKVGILGTLERSLTFRIEPFIRETDQMPLVDDLEFYELVPDDASGQQKLVLVNDDRQRPIVLFPQDISLSTIWGSDKAALILDEENLGSGFYVDIEGQSKNALNDSALVDLFDGKWSYNGLHFVFTRDSSESLWILDYQGNIYPLQLNLPLDQVSWTLNGNLLFVTQQQINAGTISGIGSDYNFGEYNPDSDIYTKIRGFGGLAGTPKNPLMTGNEGSVYFQIGEQYYQLVLK